MARNAEARHRLSELGVLERRPRFTPRKRRESPWIGSIVAIDTEGTSETGPFTATAYWDEIDPNGAEVHDGVRYAEKSAKFGRAIDLAEFLITRSKLRIPQLFYCHNLEWDMQVLWKWLGASTPLRYEFHTSRRNGSALSVTYDYEGRLDGKRKIVIRDSFALYPHSLAEMGRIVGLPKLRTPRQYIPHTVNWRTGEAIENVDPDDGADSPLCDHGLVECVDCYDLRDVAILHRAMRLYIDECNDAGLSPSLTRSAHAMKDYRTNYLDAPLFQYTERQNLRAQCARYGGRSQMLKTGLTVAGDGETIIQADIVSEYPSIMAAGGFPDAGYHRVLHHCRAERVRTYVGWAWATVDIPNLQLGPLIVRDPRDGRTSYPVNRTVQGAWTTDELAYALDLGCTITVTRLEGTPRHAAIDPFSGFITDKFRQRAEYKAAGDPREATVKLTMNGLSGKFGMRWTDPIVGFCAVDEPTIQEELSDAPCRRNDTMPVRYPDYLMVPWSAIIMARGRIMLHKFGVSLLERGAELLTCDTDSWTFRIREDRVCDSIFGSRLGEWALEHEYVAFRGAAPKEYALYETAAQLFAHEPAKSRAKGIGGLASAAEKARAIDHYLRVGNIHFQRPQKTRSVIRGAPMATFVHVEKSRHAPTPPLLPVLHENFAAFVRAQIADVESRRLWLLRNNSVTGLSLDGAVTA